MAHNAFGNSEAGVSAPVAPTGSPETYSSAVQSSGPAVYLRLDDRVRLAASDSSGHRRDGLYNNLVALGRPGALYSDPGPGAGFSNSGCCSTSVVSTFADHLPTGDAARSFELWLRTTDPSNRWLGGWGGAGTRSAFFLRVTGEYEVQLSVNGDDRRWRTPHRLTDGSWHHLVVTYDGDRTVTLFLDGLEVGSHDLDAPLQTAVAGLRLGRHHTGVDYRTVFIGDLDDVAIYDQALSAQQVASHFAASGNTRPTAPTAVTATPAPNAATVSWTPSTATTPAGQPAVTGYTVTAFDDGRPLYRTRAATTDTSVTLTGLRGGTGYVFEVEANNQFGAGPATSSGPDPVTPSGSPFTYASEVHGDDPVVYLRLDDRTRLRASDSSGHLRDAGYNSLVTLGRTGALVTDPNRAAAFSNSGCCSASAVWTFPDGLPTGSAPRSFEIWIRTSADRNRWIGGWGGAGTRRAFYLRVSGQELRVYVNGDDQLLVAPSSLTDGAWHHIVVTYDGDRTLTGYVDGDTIGEATLAAPLATSSDGLFLGRHYTSPHFREVFRGDLDEAAVYDRELTARQVRDHHAASLLESPEGRSRGARS